MSALNQIQRGSVISSATATYMVDSVLGQGSYGKVVKCVRSDSRKTVALKLIRNFAHHSKTARAEVDTLTKLKALGVQQPTWVTWNEIFTTADFTCLEYELLDKDLIELVQESKLRPLTLADIRPIIQQVASALHHFAGIGMVHADLKLDNVMLVDHKRQPNRVKVIDFGLAHAVSEAQTGSVQQTLQYRAPEILLGLPYNAAIDVWSLGCMAASLYTGKFLCCGETEYEMLWGIEQTCGRIPQHLLNRGLNTSHFYRENGPSAWKLPTPEEYFGGKPRSCSASVRSLDDFLHMRPLLSKAANDRLAERTDVRLFVDLLEGMLQVDAANRLTPSQILQHPFITMDHVVFKDHPSNYVKYCQKRMAVCPQGTKPSAPPQPPRPIGFSVPHHPPPWSNREQRQESRTTSVAQVALKEENRKPASTRKRPRSPPSRPAPSKRQRQAGVEEPLPQRRRSRSRSPCNRRSSPTTDVAVTMLAPRMRKHSPGRKGDRSRSPHDRRTPPVEQIPPSARGRVSWTDQRLPSRQERPLKERNRERSRSPCDRRTSNTGHRTAQRAAGRTRRPCSPPKEPEFDCTVISSGE